jgi:hypothetical protein
MDGSNGMAASTAAIAQKPMTNITKIVLTNAETGAKLVAQREAFITALRASLNQSGMVEYGISIESEALQNGQMHHFITTSFPSYTDPHLEQYHRGLVHGAMNPAMYAHGYGENLGVPAKGITNGWDTQFIRTGAVTSHVAKLRQGDTPANAEVYAQPVVTAQVR